ncbi:MAG TPA: hypothetical protein VFN86_11735 [Casimicrobiaceae bacterium]|nr:hypothetical protein [Casimicrobiaceae bacterium]
MTIALEHISAISLFVEDLQAAKAFHVDVFGVAKQAMVPLPGIAER